MDETVDGTTLLPQLVELRRKLHHHPELGLELPRTQAAVLQQLATVDDITVHTGLATTSVVVDLEGPAAGPTILLRGDMDALPMYEDTGLDFASEVPGRMHACGHDAHTAMLVGAVHSLAARRHELAGRVRFMFQPGEEGPGGAPIMIEEGVLDGVDAAFALHITPNLPTGWVASRQGAMLASADEFEIRIRGKGGHASSPHLALDPIPVAAEIVLALQSMITRKINAFDPAVLTVARIEAGTTSNVIPETAVIEGTIRAVSEDTRGEVVAAVQTVADGVTAAHGARAEVDVKLGYPVTINHDGFASFAAEVISDVNGVDHYVDAPAPVMGAEDFSYVTEQVPGSMAFLGVCPPEVRAGEAHACHSNRMMLHEPAMALGVDIHTAIALQWLDDPSRSA